MELTYAKVAPFITVPVKSSQENSITAWLTAINVIFTERYGDAITADREPVFLSVAGDAVTRKLVKGAAPIDAQSVGPASIRYTASSAAGGWFLPAELAQMDSICNKGGTRTVRMPAPDAIRYGNLSARFPFTTDESLEGDLEIEGS